MTVETRRQLSLRTVCANLQIMIGIKLCFRTHLNTFGIHLIIFFWLGPVKARVSFLANQQIWEVNFLELQFDWFNEFHSHEIGSLFAFEEKRLGRFVYFREQRFVGT